ncbi:MAG: PLDc N-terminal domain-containing protein [Ferruginibacter sp.]|nr:PLDc N-terminal domain-containing protein [Ferruginibacter sp.]
MKSGTIVKTSFILSFILVLVGAYQKIIHSEGADTWLMIGLIASLVFIVTAIYEVLSSERIDRSEKTMWTIALIFFSSIAGLIYILIGRKRIAANI